MIGDVLPTPPAVEAVARALCDDAYGPGRQDERKGYRALWEWFVGTAWHLVGAFPQLALEGRQEFAVRHEAGRIEGPFRPSPVADAQQRRDDWMSEMERFGCWRPIDRTVYESDWTEPAPPQ